MKYDVALAESLHEDICDDLLQHIRQGDMQEDLLFALWRPSTGADRESALIFDVIRPLAGERELHGNASFDTSYLARAVGIACQKEVGLAFIHNHLTDGWQEMSIPDIVAERDRISPPARATGYPLVGMTLGTDGSWSARIWKWDGKEFKQHWCDKVRVAGKKLRVTFNNRNMPLPKRQASLKRTIDTWGETCQHNLARLRLGVVGVGSVGGMVAEALARMGIESLLIVDPDRVETHNLDRLIHATKKDVGKYKALLTASKLRDSATAKRFDVEACTLPVENEKSVRLILDCDLIFSAVDRPLPKDLLNHIAYAHCIPVISGGVFVDSKPDGSMGQSAWGITSVGPERRCLRCDGQYTSSDVVMEKDGSLDDPTYIRGLEESGEAQTNQNVFPFSANLASLMVIEMVRLVISADWWPDSGGKVYYSLIPNLLEHEQAMCDVNCSVNEKLTMGNAYSYNFILKDDAKKDKTIINGCMNALGRWYRRLISRGG